MATAPDYYIEITDTGLRPHPWRWELHRRSTPMGIRIGAGGFQSQMAAEHAGNQALERFLDELSKKGTTEAIGTDLPVREVGTEGQRPALQRKTLPPSDGVPSAAWGRPQEAPGADG